MPKVKRQFFFSPPSRHLSVFAAFIFAGLFAFLGYQQLFSASAASAPLYNYDLQGFYGSAVPNTGEYNPSLNLTLLGDWQNETKGVHFDGNLINSMSVGSALPSTGYSLNLGANEPVAFGAAFVYSPPVTGTCFKDSSNLTQVGRFADKNTQLKLQFSKCGDNKKNVFMQCRLAGNSTSKTVKPVKSTLNLEAGQQYVAMCSKSVSGGTTTQTLTVTKLDSTGNTTVTNSYTVAATGILQSKKALSVGNKYPLPAQSANTDQYVGVIKHVTYCTGADVSEATDCVMDQLLPSGGVISLGKKPCSGLKSACHS